MTSARLMLAAIAEGQLIVTAATYVLTNRHIISRKMTRSQEAVLPTPLSSRLIAVLASTAYVARFGQV
jgi:hypothetical protein